MKKTIICFGVREYEIPYFEKLGKQYDYELVLRPEYINDSCYELALGYEVVMVRGGCPLGRESMRKLAEGGLKYYLTRTAGYNHVDVEACKEFGIETAFVPGYSPNAISELAVTLSMMLLRHASYATDLAKQGKFKVTNTMFSREIRGCTVGILGCGRIGCTSASLFKGLGAKVIGYDVFVSDRAKELMEMKSAEEVFAEADILVCHMAYVKGKNDRFIDKGKIALMKKGSIIVNVARGEVMDTKAALDAVKSGQLDGLGLDVVENEGKLFNKEFDPANMGDPLFQEMVDLYPKVLVTPHIGSATDLALVDMIEVSLKNMDEYLATGQCKNSLIK
ncbi:MAG: lactate dehydrogenase [Bacilli bacterium]|nr:lactate dehydrogenase [Bacilli bacterium]